MAIATIRADDAAQVKGRADRPFASAAGEWSRRIGALASVPEPVTGLAGDTAVDRVGDHCRPLRQRGDGNGGT